MRKTNEKLADVVGILCGVFLLAVMIWAAVGAINMGKAGLSAKEIPADAITLTGTAAGRNGDVTVQVIVSEDEIYRIDVLEQEETRGIGTEAVKKLPLAIYDAQSLKVDNVGGATLTSDAIKNAIINALKEGGLDVYAFDGGAVKLDNIAKVAETGSGVVVLSAKDWAEEYPNQYASYMRNAENDQTEDYVEEYPMIATLFEGYGFAKYYTGARGHTYVIEEVTSTGRPHAMANCFTCKTPDFTAMALEMGDAAYSQPFEDVLQQVNEPLNCFNCHASQPGEVTVTHTYLSKALGEDVEHVDAADLACGQCHVDYYFDPGTKATTLPYTNLAVMNPDDMLDYYNDLMVDGEVFADYVNPRTGVRQIMINHPELETYLGEGSVHRGMFTCADCHMGDAVAEDGTVYKNHYLVSPLANQELIDNTCSKCHSNLEAQVRAIQEKMEKRTYDIGYKLEDLTNKLADAVESGDYTDAELDAMRMTYRSAQYYWNFVFVENSEGAHNSALDNQCLDKSEALMAELEGMFH